MTRYTPMYVQDGSYAASQDRRLINALWPAARSTGCAVTVASGMTVNVAPGTVAVPTQNNTGSTLCVSDANEQVVVAAAPPSGQSRIDLVICRPRDFDLDGSSNSDFIFDTVQGVPAASAPAIPATPAGTVALYQVTVPGGAASLVAGNLADVRPGSLAIGSAPPPASYPRGQIAQTVGPATAVSCGATPTAIMTLSAAIQAGRRYRVSVFAFGQQLTVTGANTYFDLLGPLDSAQGRFQQTNNLAISYYLIGQAVFTSTPTASSTPTWTLRGSATAGSMSITANQCTLLLEDMGSQ